jgi:5-formyltetrahydrofolate cyclo-ligase
VAQTTPETRALRQQLRQRRLQLTPDERRDAERIIARRLQSLRIFRPGARVGIYMAMRGEAGLAGAIRFGLGVRAKLFAPAITSMRRRTMAFVPFDGRLALRLNAFGIAEPRAAPARRLSALQLDAVLVPLVGFDRAGHRLGMGAGYYDRALSRRRDTSRPWHRPKLVGIAYACQEAQAIEPAPWDVSLDAVVTEREVVRCSQSP